MPVIAQFCGDSPELIGKAAQLIGRSVAAIDINLGCPQVQEQIYTQEQ